MEDLKETIESVMGLSSERLGIPEQALPLAERIYGTYGRYKQMVRGYLDAVWNEPRLKNLIV